MVNYWLMKSEPHVYPWEQLVADGSTHWDGPGHIFYEDKMWNGYDCREVTSAGAQKCGIEKTKDKMVGRGVLLDVARALGKSRLEDGYAITCEDLDYTCLLYTSPSPRDTQKSRMPCSA